jgi:hypothetical protein
MLTKLKPQLITALATFIFMVMALPAQADSSADGAALKEIIEADPLVIDSAVGRTIRADYICDVPQATFCLACHKS